MNEIVSETKHRKMFWEKSQLLRQEWDELMRGEWIGEEMCREIKISNRQQTT